MRYAFIGSLFLLAAVGASAQPAITSVDAYIPNTTRPGGPAVDAGLSLPFVTLAITGSGFMVPGDAGVQPVYVIWDVNGDATELPAVIPVSDTEIDLQVPSQLFAIPGAYAMQLLVSDSTSNTTTFTVNAHPSALSLPDGNVAVPYSGQLVAGGEAPFTKTGTLPSWLQFSSDGTVSGTPTQEAQGLTFNLTVTDAWNQPVTQQWVINSITAPPPGYPYIITSSPLPTARTGYTYSVTLQASFSPAVWATGDFPPPPGLTLSSAGVLSGTPTQTGTFTFDVSARQPQTDNFAAKQFTLTVVEGVLVITTATLPAGTENTRYSASLAAQGGIPPYTWEIASGALPAGLSLDAASGRISGTPSAAGTANFAVQVNDSTGQPATRAFSVPIKAIVPPLEITTSSPLPDATTGSPASVQFAATGGLPPYTWFANGNIPPGLAFSGGVLSGTPNTAGNYTFTVQVIDSQKANTFKNFALSVLAGPLTVTTSALPAGRTGQPYVAALEAAGGVLPYQWSATGLPAGLAANEQGVINGTPTAAGTFPVAATVTDSQGNKNAKNFNLEILPSLTITSTSPLPSGTAGEQYDVTLTATGGTPPYTWALADGFIGSLSLSAAGAISGVPGAAGVFPALVKVTDSHGVTDSKLFTLNIAAPAFSITETTLPAATAGAPYAFQLQATGASGEVTWSATGLPGGLQLGTGGTITGTPSAAGIFGFTVNAQDAAGNKATVAFTLTVGLPPLPAVTYPGVSETAGPATQPAVGLGLDGTYPLPLTGTVTLTFAADGGGDDATVQFSSGGRTAGFTIPAGTNLATFTTPNLALQAGTVAGTITLTTTLQSGSTDVTPTPPPTQTIRINAAAPVITNLTVTRTTTGFDVTITGYSTPRSVTQANFAFTGKAGASLGTHTLTIPVDALFGQWYQDPASLNYGSQFTFTQPFNLQGDTTAVSSVAVTLANSVGTSNSMTANVP